MPWHLYEVLEEHAVECGYENLNQMLVFMPLYSLTVRTPHHATAPISRAPAELQDEIIKQIVQDYKAGIKKHSSYFENLLKDIVSSIAVPVESHEIESAVSSRLKIGPVRKTTKSQENSQES